MRTAYTDKSISFTEDGKLQGFCLGFDFCAEHEQNVFGLKRTLGIKACTKESLPQGIDDRQITIVPKSLKFITGWRVVAKPSAQEMEKLGITEWKPKKEPVAMLVCDDKPWAPIPDELSESRISFGKTAINKFAAAAKEFGISVKYLFTESYKRSYKPEYDLVTLWDSSEFAILVKGEEKIAALTQLYEAFLRKDIVLGLTPTKNWFGNGLTFMVKSSITKEDADLVLHNDNEYIKLLEAVESTGIAKTLKNAGCSYYALVPKWDKDGQLKFWLNPCAQSQNASGWYGLEDLEAWAKGTGPVIKLAA